MSATQELFSRLQTLAPSGVPSDLQVPLAEQLRDLARDLELQARFDALPPASGPSTSGHSTPLNRLIADPITSEPQSSVNWQTIDGLPSTSTPSTPLNRPVVADPVKSEDHSSTNWQTIDESDLRPDSSPSALNGTSIYNISPGSDRQMPLFSKYGSSAYRQSPLLRSSILRPSSTSFSFEGDDDDFSVLTPQTKQTYRDASAHLLREGSSLSEVLSHDSTTSVYKHPAEMPSCDWSESIEDEDTTEPSSILIDRGELVPDNPFWGQPPKNYPSVDISNNSPSSHNRFKAPVNRSHKLLLAMEAAKQDQNKAFPFPAREQEIVSAVEAADQSSTLQSTTSSDERGTKAGVEERPKKVRALNKPSFWNALTHLVVHIVGGKKKSRSREKAREIPEDRMTDTVEKDTGHSSAKKSSRGLFSFSPKAASSG
jgi:hypothetical protein